MSLSSIFQHLALSRTHLVKLMLWVLLLGLAFPSAMADFTLVGPDLDSSVVENSTNGTGPETEQDVDDMVDDMTQYYGWCYNYLWYTPDVPPPPPPECKDKEGRPCGSQCSIGDLKSAFMIPDFKVGAPPYGLGPLDLPPRLPRAQAGDPSGGNEQIVHTASAVEPFRSTYMHWADDYAPADDSYLKVTRYHQTRSYFLNSSLGRGSFLNFDVRLDFGGSFSSEVPDIAEVIDPSSFARFHFLDDTASSTSYIPWDRNRSKGLYFFDHQMNAHSETALSSAKYARLDLWDGSYYLFELISISNPTAMTSTSVGAAPTHGRLVEAKNARGFGYEVEYKTFTSSELTASPLRLWQMDTVTDHLNNTLTFSYHTSQVGGQWAVSTIDLPNGDDLTYSYNGAFLEEVELDSASKATFEYSTTTGGNLRWEIADMNADAKHRRKTVYTTGSATTSGGVVTPTAVGLAVVVANGEHEVVYASFDTGSLQRLIYHGGGKIRELDPSDDYKNTYYEDGWTLTIESGEFNDVVGTQESESAVKIDHSASTTYHVGVHLGVPDETYDETGVHREYTYDSDGNAIYIHYDDDTFEAFCYDSSQRVTRYRDRNGHVTLRSYDSSGRPTKTEFGLTDSSSNQPSVDSYGALAYDRCATDDVQTSAYGKIQWQYHSSGNGAGLVSKMIDELGNETDYQYDSSHRLYKVILPADASGGSRPEIERTFDSEGRVKKVINALDEEIEYFYDSEGRLISTLYDDGTTEKRVYGTSGNADGLLEKTIDRKGVVTKLEYDAADRMTKRITAYAQMSGTTETQTPDLASEETWTYVDGGNSPAQYRRNGALTKYIYDYRGRLAQSLVYTDSSGVLATQQVYVDNRLFYSSDPHGRKTYYAYDSTDGRLIRTVTGTTKEFSLASFAAVIALTRDFSANADYVITDMVYDAEGNLTRQHNGRNMATEFEYDSRNRQTARIADADYTDRSTLSNLATALELRSETIYDAASNVTETRSPRYFDSGDTEGYQKAKETWTYTGRNLVATHNVAPGTSVADSESYSYDLRGRRIKHTDFAGEEWETHFEDCCGKVIASENPLGDGSIARKDAAGRSVHTVAVEDYSSHTTALDNPVDAKTYREVTTKYDGRGRPVARTTWLTARGTVDIDDPPIAGLGGVSASAGLTEQYLYDDDLSDSTGLSSTSGVTPLIGSTAIKLGPALTKLADTVANGGAGVSFDSDAPGSARVSINPEGEIRFAISDAAGRGVMSGILDPSDSSLLSWNCQVHDATSSISGYGTVLVSQSVNALGKTRKQLTDAAGRTIQSVDALGKITSYEYDAAGNQTKVRDPNSVGQDCTYDALGRDLTCTDTGNDATSSTYDADGNKITATDAKSETTTYTFDARGRQIKVTDRLSGETEFSYTDTGQLASLTDAEDQVTSYTYNDAGQKLTETYPDHTPSTSPGDSGYGIVTFTLDPTGRVIRKQDQLGDTVTYNYDLAGRLTSRNYRTAANSPSGTIADTDTFTYDDASRMLTAVSGRYGNTVTYTYDDAGRKATEALTINSVTYTTTTEYDDAGQVSTLTYPDGSEVDRTYSDRGQLATISLDSTTMDTRTYDDGGRMLTSTYNNGVVETRSYNNDNTLASISYTGAAIGNLSYGWDANKNKTSETITGTMSGYGFDVGTSGYDDEDRLINWERDDTNLDQSWSLSLVGDWNSVTENSSTQTRTHGNAHELLTAASQSITHDVKGNMTSIPAVLRPGSDPLALTWDFDNRLVSADVDNDSTADVTYEWDALGRRVARDDGTTNTVYVQNGQQTIADYTSGTAATSPTYTYVYASYIDEPVVRDGTGGLRFYHRTQQYSVTALTESSATIKERYAYDAYGTPGIFDASGVNRSATAEGNRHLYTGREWDEKLGLYHYRARMYDAVSGKFCSRDPIGFNGNQWNLSEYVAGRPLVSIDPSGLERGLVQLPVVAQCSCDDNRDLVDVANRLDDRNRWKNHHFHVLYLDAAKLAKQLNKLNDEQPCGGCIAELDLYSHANPSFTYGIVHEQNPDINSPAPTTSVRWLSTVKFCHDCVIYLAGCNTGLGGAPLAQSIANVTGCTVRATRGYSFGSTSVSACIPNSHLWPWGATEPDTANGYGPMCTSWHEPNGGAGAWLAPFPESCSAGAADMWVDIEPNGNPW